MSHRGPNAAAQSPAPDPHVGAGVGDAIAATRPSGAASQVSPAVTTTAMPASGAFHTVSAGGRELLILQPSMPAGRNDTELREVRQRQIIVDQELLRMRNDLDKSGDRARTLQSAVTCLHERVMDANERERALPRAVDSLQCQLVEERNKHAHLKSLYENVLRGLQGLHQEVGSLRRLMREKDREVADLRACMDERDREAADLRASVADLRAGMEEKDGEVTNLRASMGGVDEELADLCASMAAMGARHKLEMTKLRADMDAAMRMAFTARDDAAESIADAENDKPPAQPSPRLSPAAYRVHACSAQQ